MNKTRYVADTFAIIAYFSDVFDVSDSELSKKASNIIADAFNEFGKTILIIPGIVFEEIFNKWFRNEELARKIYYEVFSRIKDASNIQIRETDIELIETFFALSSHATDLENRDRTILACAIMLECDLITVDTKIKSYVELNNLSIKIIG